MDSEWLTVSASLLEIPVAVDALVEFARRSDDPQPLQYVQRATRNAQPPSLILPALRVVLYCIFCLFEEGIHSIMGIF